MVNESKQQQQQNMPAFDQFQVTLTNNNNNNSIHVNSHTNNNSVVGHHHMQQQHMNMQTINNNNNMNNNSGHSMANMMNTLTFNNSNHSNPMNNNIIHFTTTSSTNQTTTTSSNNNQQQQVQHEVVSNLFKGFEFCLSGKFTMIQRKFEGKIIQYGGSVQKSINSVVTHLISTDDELQQTEKAVKVTKALQKGLPIIREEFIHDSIKNDSLQDLDKYTIIAAKPIPPPQENDKEKDNANNNSGSGSSKKRKSNASNKNNDKVQSPSSSNSLGSPTAIVGNNHHHHTITSTTNNNPSAHVNMNSNNSGLMHATLPTNVNTLMNVKNVVVGNNNSQSNHLTTTTTSGLTTHVSLDGVNSQMQMPITNNMMITLPTASGGNTNGTEDGPETKKLKFMEHQQQSFN
ncbi:hypothetical protein ABK040_001053 [Willaertia magna]